MIANLILLLTAALWGFAFVAQSKGSQSLDAFSYNAIRFALGALFVRGALYKGFRKPSPFMWQPGLVLFIAASLQQVGIYYTTAGAAGFITGLYVIFVPIIGLMRKQSISKTVLLAILLATPGLYLVNSVGDLRASLGNLMVLVSAVFWALHVQLVDKYGKSRSTGSLAFGQFALCAILSAGFAMIWRLFKYPDAAFSGAYFAGFQQAFWPILYGGLISVGIAYTLQIKAQKQAEPAAAALILCLEGVFALLGSHLILKESLSHQNIIGAILMFLAMVLCSLPKKTIDRNSGPNLSAQT